MKSKMFSVVSLLALVVGIFAFSTPAPAAAAVCGTPQVQTLFAGQTIDAGTVTVANDDNYLYVTFTTANGWLLSETHLHVADSLAGIPTNKKGNPQIGQFDHQRSYDPPAAEDTYVIAKSALSLDENDSVTIAAHAVVVQLDGNGDVIASETGWAEGPRFVDKGSWATYFQYTWQDCSGGDGGDSGTETAFAYGGGSNAADEDATTCFLNLDLDNDGSGDFNRWGWTNGPLAEGSYSFDIYAGAGQCDINKGTFVGTLSVDYSNETATVTYTMQGSNPDTGLPYEMVETHLYVGSEPLARDVNSDFTVAPGQYLVIHGELDNVTSDSYTVDGLSGDIYVVAHATVAGFPVAE